MKVCLINPPIDFSNNSEAVPNLGLGYIYAMLQRNKIDVDWIECDVEHLDVDHAVNTILSGNYDLVGISTQSYSINNVIRICVKLRRKSKNVFIWLGGYLPSIVPELLLKKLDKIINCCAVGEGEYTTVELVNALKTNSDIRSIKGIAYLDNNKHLVVNQREWIEDLDDLAFPAQYRPSTSASIISGRGCYGNCSFCAAPAFFSYHKKNAVRKRSVNNVILEMEALYQTGTRFFKFEDDNFAVLSKKSNWIQDFCSELESRNMGISFRVLLRANDVIKLGDQLSDLKKVGLDYIFIGIESFVQRQLRFYQKGVTKQTNINAIEILKKHQIQIRMGFILLDPFSTVEETIDNLMQIQNLKIYNHLTSDHPLISQMATLTPILGSNFYDYLIQNHMLRRTPLQYEFADEKIGIFYQAVEKWVQLLDDRQITYTEELFKLDLMFLLETLLAIDKGNTNIEFFVKKYQSYLS